MRKWYDWDQKHKQIPRVFKPWKEFGFPSKDHEQPLGNLRSIKGQSDLYFRIMAPVSVWSIDWIGARMEAEGSARGHCESLGRMWWWFWSMLVVEVKIKGSSEITESMWLQFFNFCKLFLRKFFFLNKLALLYWFERVIMQSRNCPHFSFI